MAIRLRWVQDTWVALCAMESEPKDKDIYLDDAQHEALATKFGRDWEAILIPGSHWGDENDSRVALMKTQEVL